jgi:1-acyl-sn-glycerol-3-phosphate acyltransferase
VLYYIARFIFKVYFILANRVTVKGADNIPETGGAIICPNHIHWLDPLLIGTHIKRTVFYMAKAELFTGKLSSFILKGINAFPVKRGTADISAIKYSFKVIKKGAILGIFPEGTRSKNGELLPAEPGAALIALKTNVPVIPIRVKGSYSIFGRLSITIGKPMDLSGYMDRKLTSDEINEASQNIMEEIKKLD